LKFLILMLMFWFTWRKKTKQLFEDNEEEKSSSKEDKSSSYPFKGKPFSDENIRWLKVKVLFHWCLKKNRIISRTEHCFVLTKRMRIRKRRVRKMKEKVNLLCKDSIKGFVLFSNLFSESSLWQSLSFLKWVS
jgi:hypothetical protein